MRFSPPGPNRLAAAPQPYNRPSALTSANVAEVLEPERTVAHQRRLSDSLADEPE
jgi:hypothetical protein